MADVAAAVGVSRTLVSMVIRGATGPSAKTREKVLAAAMELGYHPDMAARTLRGVAKRRLGVVFDMSQPFEVEVVEHVYRAAGESGYDVIVGPLTASRSQDAVLRELLGYRAEALIVIAPTVDLKDLGVFSETLHVPLVEVGRMAKAKGYSVVRTNDGDGVKQSVDHLVELGHRRIAHIDGGTRPGAVERRNGYRRRMAYHGLEDHVRIVEGDYTEVAGAAGAAELLASPEPPTAIIAGNDRAAVGVLDSARRAGLEVPTRLSVVGYDDSHFARLAYIGLTTIRQDSAELAQRAVETLVEHLENDGAEPRKFVLKPSLVIRESTGPAPA
jgi:DNA-binding LacI/PurR family transcriptional regulator